MELYRALFLRILTSVMAFLFLSLMVRTTAAMDVFIKTSDGGLDRIFCHMFGPQAAPSLNLNLTPAQRACHKPL